MTKGELAFLDVGVPEALPGKALINTHDYTKKKSQAHLIIYH